MRGRSGLDPDRFDPMAGRSLMSHRAPSYHDLAHWYDALYAAAGKDYEAEAEFVLGLVRERGVVATSLLDVACGTGRHLEAFARQVDEAFGVDLSDKMLAVARRRLDPAVGLQQADMQTFELGRTFDVVTCLFSSIGHVDDAAALDRSVRAMAAHVAPGGLLVVEPWLTPDRVLPGLVDLMTARVDDGVIARAASTKRDGEVLDLSFAWAIATPGGATTIEESLPMALFTDERHLEAVRRAGLEASWLDDVPAMMANRGLLLGFRPG